MEPLAASGIEERSAAGAAPDRGSGKTRRRQRRAAELALTAATTDIVDPATEALFERLRTKRRELAAEQAVPPYVVFHDSTLAAMAVHRPQTPAEFLRLGGVGHKKLERYGEIFMQVIRSDISESERKPGDAGD
jgi:superfamily II DNA helicase RecQ